MKQIKGDAVRENVRTMNLPVILTRMEVEVRAKELASSVGTLRTRRLELDQFVEASKGTKKSMEADVEEILSEVSRLGEIVQTEKEPRDVKVYDVLDFEAGAVRTVREDTGDVVGTRGMSEAERQRSLFGVAADDAAAKA